MNHRNDAALYKNPELPSGCRPSDIDDSSTVTAEQHDADADGVDDHEDPERWDGQS